MPDGSANNSTDESMYSDGEGYDPPPVVAKISSGGSGHIEEVMDRVNAFFFFNRKNREEKRRADALRLEEGQRRMVEERRACEEKEYPTKDLIRFDPSSKDELGDLHLKGTVMLPSNETIHVEAVALFRSDHSRGRTLLVLRRIDDSISEGGVRHYYPVICDDDGLLPDSTRYKLGDMNDELRRRKYAIADTRSTMESFGAVDVKRKNHDESLNLIITAELRPNKEKNPFQGMVCCKDMLNTLLYGTVRLKISTISSSRKGLLKGVKASTRKTRKEFVLLPRPFNAGVVRDCTSAYRLSRSADGTMHLSYASVHNQSTGEEIFQSAEKARDRLFGKAMSFDRTLKELEKLSYLASITPPTKYEIFLNVALGGTPWFPSHGKFLPCAVDSSKYQYPNGSFDSTPCTCDVEVIDSTSTDVAIDLVKKHVAGHAKAKKGK